MTDQVFIRTKKQPTTWSHASVPPSGALFELGSVVRTGAVGKPEGADLASSISREQSESKFSSLCSPLEEEPMRSRERGGENT